MKKLFYSLLVLLLMASCGQNASRNNQEGTSRIDTTNTDSDYRADSLPVDDAQVPTDGTRTEEDGL